jgi:hypothetical protein
MIDGNPPVRRLQLMLRGTCCTDNARENAKHTAQKMGMDLSGEGHATLSARMSDAEFRTRFSDTSGAVGALPVPEQLKPFVSSISEAPEHLSFR